MRQFINFIRSEIASMIESYRQNVRWARGMEKVGFSDIVPCAEWCHDEAARVVTDKVIGKMDDRDVTERKLNEYRLAKYEERSVFRRHAPAQEQVRRDNGQVHLRWPVAAQVA